MSFKRLQRALFRTMAAVVALAILFCIGLYGYRTMFGYTYDSSLSDEDLAASVTADENITNIALFGLDTREGDKQSHSDCMMIVTVDNILDPHSKIEANIIMILFNFFRILFSSINLHLFFI